MFGSTDEFKASIGFQAAVMEAGEETEGDFDKTLENVLTAASEVVNEYISGRYDATLYAGNAVLTRIAYAIGRYDVYTMFARDQLPEAIAQEKRDCMKTLEQIAKGELMLTPDTPEEDAPEPVSSEFESATQVFSTILM